MAVVFVSYSRKDTEFVRKLTEALAQRNHNVWVDWKEIRGGTEWWEEIITGIEGADKFIFVISPDAIDSEYCGKEIEHAVSQNKNILPIFWRSGLGNKCIPLHPAVSRHHYISFEGRDDFDQAIQELDGAIALNIDLFHVHKRLLVKAIEWNNNGREESFLLRGKELESAETWLSKSADKDPKPTESQVTYIEISRKVEDANNQADVILQKAVKQADRIKVISLAVSLLILIGSCGTIFFIYQSTQSAIANANQEASDAKSEAEKNKKEAKDVKLEADKRIANANKEADKKTEKALMEAISKKRIEAQNYSPDLSILQPVNKDESPNRKATVYIQVPSDSIKNKLQNENFRARLESNGYKAPGIEIMDQEISPNENQIRYFVSTEKDRAEKLQNDLKSLNNPSYQNFKVTYVRGFEKKVKPEMLEVWFGKKVK
jgi:F0F1-type ATP synthase membrane subunit b/b'